MTEATEPQLQNGDFWEDSGAFWWRPLPATSVHQLVSAEYDIITITKEGDVYWLNDHTAVGEDDYPTLQEAKDAGDRVISILDAQADARISSSEGLDIEQWHILEEGDHVWFRNMTDHSLRIDYERDGTWTAYSGENEVGTAHTAKEATLLLVPEQTPRP